MHATKHFVNTGHNPVIVALPDKLWRWCRRHIHKIYR